MLYKAMLRPHPALRPAIIRDRLTYLTIGLLHRWSRASGPKGIPK